MCSAAPRWMSRTREVKITLDSFIFIFTVRLGNLKKNRIRSQLTPPLLASLIQGERKAQNHSIPSTSTAMGNQGAHHQSSVACQWCSGHTSHSKATILPTQIFCLSFCSVCTAQSGQRTCFKTALKAAQIF